MQITKQTLKIMENFNKINNNILIQANNPLFTCDTNKTIWAKAKISEKIDKKVPIYDLGTLVTSIKTLSDEESPELTFNDDHLVIKNGQYEQMYKYTSEDYLVYPEKVPPNRTPEFKFDITNTEVKLLHKAFQNNRANEISFNSDGKSFKVELYDNDIEDTNKFVMNIDVDVDKTVFNLKMDSAFFMIFNNLYDEFEKYTVEFHFNNSVKYVHIYNDIMDFWMSPRINSVYEGKLESDESELGFTD